MAAAADQRVVATTAKELVAARVAGEQIRSRLAEQVGPLSSPSTMSLPASALIVSACLEP